MSSEATGAVADRYSAALFELADERSVLVDVATDLRTVKALIQESEELRRMMWSPVLTRAAQQKAVVALAERTRLGELTRNFLRLLARNRRLYALPGIIEAYLNRLAARRGEVSAKVTSAVALNETQVGAVGVALKKVVGSNVMLDVTVDPALLGGLVVKVGSRMVDGSLRTKLQQLKIAMKGVG